MISTMPGRKPGSRRARPVVPLFTTCRPSADTYDEVFNPDATPHPGLEGFVRLLDNLGDAEFRLLRRLAVGEFLQEGITFSVYSDSRGVEKIMPFDLIPHDAGQATTPGAKVGSGDPHAWAQRYLPGAGWVEVDPTNGLVGGSNVIRIAITRDPDQAIPVSGSFTGPPGAFLDLSVDVIVTANGR